MAEIRAAGGWNRGRPLQKRRAGVLGAFAYSGANFVLAFGLQGAVPKAEFGTYAFALVLVQFGLSLSNALFAAPLSVACAEGEDPGLIGSFCRANLGAVTLGAGILGAVLVGLGVPPLLTLLFMAQAALLWLRWFFRAVDLARHHFARPAQADLIYGAVTLGLGLALYATQRISTEGAVCAMLAGTGISTLMLARGKMVWGPIAPFLASFRRYGGWALIGVITTEITANLHAYVLALWFGPAAFAPVALLSLFFRPIPILMQALTQIERPVLARWYHEGAAAPLTQRVRGMTGMMAAAVLANTALIAAILIWSGGDFGKGQYRDVNLWPLVLLLAAGQLVRGLRTGPSTAAQGAGLFRPLAFATIWAAPVTLIGTAGAALIGWQVVPMVLGAVLAGEVVTALSIQRLYRGLLRGSKDRIGPDWNGQDWSDKDWSPAR